MAAAGSSASICTFCQDEHSNGEELCALQCGHVFHLHWYAVNGGRDGVGLTSVVFSTAPPVFLSAVVRQYKGLTFVQSVLCVNNPWEGREATHFSNYS
jgi:hypothetical protein